MSTPQPTGPIWITLRRLAPVVVVLVIAALLLIEARHVHLREIQRTLAAIAPWRLALLGIGGVIAVATIASYDLLAARVLGIARRPGASLRTGLMASGINNVASLSGMTGSGLRILLLARDGVDTRAAVSYAGLVALAAPLGLSALSWAVLMADPPLLAATGMPIWLVRAVLALLAAYLPMYVIVAGTPILRRGRFAGLVQLRIGAIAAFVAASILEWLLAAGLLWSCLAVVGLTLPPVTVATAFVLAAALGIASFLPGGLGVFDVVLAALLVARGAAADAVVAALVLYRYSYYLVPLFVALFIGSHELRASRLGEALRTHPLVNLLQWPLARIAELGIRLLSALTALAGVVLLGGAAFPNLMARTRLLREWVPLGAVEASHLISVIVGLALIATARGLSLRLHRALWLSIGLLVAGAASGLTRGLDWGTSLLLSAVALLLFASRSTFDRKGSLGRQIAAWQWTLALVIALLVYLLLGQALYTGHTLQPFRFAFGAQGPRFLRGAFVAMISVIVLVIWTWPRWPRPSFILPESADLDRLADWLHQHGSNGYSHLLMLGDKVLRYGRDGESLIGFTAIRNRLVALGDPIGSTEARKQAIADFRRFAETMHCTPVFYQVAPDDLSLYLDNGFALFKLGEIAHVDLKNFSMKGRVNEDKRGAINRGNRLGLTFELTTAPFAAALLAEMRAVSDEWLGKRGSEKAFSLGRFDPDYLARAPVALVRDAQARLVAFASVVPSYGHRDEYSIDLMRHRGDAPSGTMDFLFVRLMQEAQAMGYARFSLGMAPLAGVGDTPWASTAEQLARLAFEHGNRFYNYKGLRAFKDKWNPAWQSMYLAYPPEARLSSIQLDLAALIAGGYRRIVAGA